MPTSFRIHIRSGIGFAKEKIYLSLKSSQELIAGLTLNFGGYLRQLKVEPKKRLVHPKNKKDFQAYIEENLFKNMSNSERKKEIRRIIQKRKEKMFSLAKGKNFLVKNIESTNFLKKEIKEQRIQKFSKKEKLKWVQVFQKKLNLKQRKLIEYNFALQRHEMWKSMKSVLLRSLQLQESVISFYQFWVVAIYLVQILDFFDQWRLCQKRRDYNIKKVKKYFIRCLFLCLL